MGSSTAGAISGRILTRRCFRLAQSLGTTRSVRTSSPLPCRKLAGSRRSYLQPAPRVERLNHLVDHRQAPGTSPAARFLPRLVMSVAKRFTSLVGRYPTGLTPVRTRVPPSRSRTHAAARAFLGAENRSSPLPFGAGFRCPAPSLALLTGKPSTGLSWLSFSRPGFGALPSGCAFLAEYPGAVSHPTEVLTNSLAPHAGRG